MGDSRRLPRRYLFFYLRVFDQVTGDLLGYLSNINNEGVMITSDLPMKEGSILEMKMTVPGNIEENNMIHFTAKVIWCRKDEQTNYYDSGMALTEISEKNEELIKNLITRFTKPEKEL
jgi:hypothetical protein